MRILLTIMFASILLAMIAVTTVASLDQSIFNAAGELLSDRWFQATLCDAYFGFLTFYAWVAYKERGTFGRIAWFVLIMCLGNIAMSLYMLMQLSRHPRGAPLSLLLLRTDYDVRPSSDR